MDRPALDHSENRETPAENAQPMCAEEIQSQEACNNSNAVASTSEGSASTWEAPPVAPGPSFVVEILPPKSLHDAPPPSYDEATGIAGPPTYTETVQKIEDDLFGVYITENPPVYPTAAVAVGTATTAGVAPTVLVPVDSETGEEIDTSYLGTDFMFYMAFFVAFVFNWIGFLLLMCFCQTIASRYGALSGFGLSLAKWMFIMQHSADIASRQYSWLWWFIMMLGLIICVRTIMQYVHVKRNWRTMSADKDRGSLYSF